MRPGPLAPLLAPPDPDPPAIRDECVEPPRPVRPNLRNHRPSPPPEAKVPLRLPDALPPDFPPMAPELLVLPFPGRPLSENVPDLPVPDLVAVLDELVEPPDFEDPDE